MSTVANLRHYLSEKTHTLYTQLHTTYADKTLYGEAIIRFGEWSGRRIKTYCTPPSSPSITPRSSPALLPIPAPDQRPSSVWAALACLAYLPEYTCTLVGVLLKLLHKIVRIAAEHHTAWRLRVHAERADRMAHRLEGLVRTLDVKDEQARNQFAAELRAFKERYGWPQPNHEVETGNKLSEALGQIYWVNVAFETKLKSARQAQAYATHRQDMETFTRMVDKDGIVHVAALGDCLFLSVAGLLNHHWDFLPDSPIKQQLSPQTLSHENLRKMVADYYAQLDYSSPIGRRFGEGMLDSLKSDYLKEKKRLTAEIKNLPDLAKQNLITKEECESGAAIANARLAAVEAELAKFDHMDQYESELRDTYIKNMRTPRYHAGELEIEAFGRIFGIAFTIEQGGVRRPATPPSPLDSPPDISQAKPLVIVYSNKGDHWDFRLEDSVSINLPNLSTNAGSASSAASASPAPLKPSSANNKVSPIKV